MEMREMQKLEKKQEKVQKQDLSKRLANNQDEDVDCSYEKQQTYQYRSMMVDISCLQQNIYFLKNKCQKSNQIETDQNCQHLKFTRKEIKEENEYLQMEKELSKLQQIEIKMSQETQKIKDQLLEIELTIQKGLNVLKKQELQMIKYREQLEYAEVQYKTLQKQKARIANLNILQTMFNIEIGLTAVSINGQLIDDQNILIIVLIFSLLQHKYEHFEIDIDFQQKLMIKDGIYYDIDCSNSQAILYWLNIIAEQVSNMNDQYNRNNKQEQFDDQLLYTTSLYQSNLHQKQNYYAVLIQTCTHLKHLLQK